MKPLPLAYLDSKFAEASQPQVKNALAKHRYYRLLKALSMNEAFIGATMLARKELEIPLGGISVNEFVRIREIKQGRREGTLISEDLQIEYYPINGPEGVEIEILNPEVFKESHFFNGKSEAYLRMKEKTKYLEKFRRSYEQYLLTSSIWELVLANVVVVQDFPEPPPITIFPERGEFGHVSETHIDICISQCVSREQLINFIKENWEEISERLGKKDNFMINEKDFEIYRLRQFEGFKHKEVADYIEDKYPDKILGEDGVKQYYSRVKKKIDALYL